MKKYSKPEAWVLNLQIKQALASLNRWLEDQQLTGAGVTTYIVQS